MQRVNISTLRRRLSHYLKQVQQGDELLVLDRNTPIAKVVRVPVAERGLPDSELIARLVQAGSLRPAEKSLPADFFDSMPRCHTSVVEALLQEREEGL